MSNYHKSVLLQESIEGINVKRGQKYIDATLGGGGHSLEIVNRGGIVLGIDADKEAIDFVSQNQASRIKNQELRLVQGNFRNIDKIARENGFEKVSGILFDLGVSSHQLDSAERGFSYLLSSPLDMRMDQGLGVKASDLVNALGKKELYEIFKDFGEERRANAVVDLIISRRKIAPFQTTADLSLTLATAYGFRDITDFAKATSSKRVFQALRMVVNDEMGSLKEALPNTLKILGNKGRLVIITFHSLEDRMVKQAFKSFEKEGKGVVITKKPVLPSSEEQRLNSRSKSAKLRIFEMSS